MWIKWACSPNFTQLSPFLPNLQLIGRCSERGILHPSESPQNVHDSALGEVLPVALDGSGERTWPW